MYKMFLTYYSVTYQPGSGNSLVLYWFDASPCSNCPQCNNAYAIAVYGNTILRICINVVVQIAPDIAVVWNGDVSSTNGFTVYGGGQEYLPVTPVSTIRTLCTDPAITFYAGNFNQRCAPLGPGVSVPLLPYTYNLGDDKLIISAGQGNACGATYSAPIYTLNYSNPILLCSGNNKVNDDIYVTWDGASINAASFLVYYQSNAISTPIAGDYISTDCDYVSSAGPCVIAPTGQHGEPASSSRWWIWVLVGIGGLILIIAIIGLVVYFHDRPKSSQTSVPKAPKVATA